MDYGLVLFAAGLIENSLQYLRKNLKMPYRKEDKEGRPIGFDWGKVAVRVCFALAFGAALGAVIVTSWPDSPPAMQTMSDACHDAVYDDSNVVCSHPLHELRSLGGTYLCSCRRAYVPPKDNSSDVEFIKGEISALSYILEQNQKTLHELKSMCPNNFDEVPTIDLNQTEECSGTSSGSCN